MIGTGPHRSPVLITDPVVPDCLDLLRADPAIETLYRPGLEGEELRREIADCEGLIVRSGTQVTRAVIEAGVLLKAIARAGTGVERFGTIMAGAFLGLVPTLVLYFIGQKYFVQGLARSALKG